MKTKVINSWNQVDGGMRYEVAVDNHTVTVDVDARGKVTGFVRGICSSETERKVLEAAFKAIR